MELEDRHLEHPDSDMDGGSTGEALRQSCIFFASGHFMYTSPRSLPGGRTALVAQYPIPEEHHCMMFSFHFSQEAGIGELLVKTGLEGEEQIIWRMKPPGQEIWVVGQVLRIVIHT